MGSDGSNLLVVANNRDRKEILGILGEAGFEDLVGLGWEVLVCHRVPPWRGIFRLHKPYRVVKPET